MENYFLKIFLYSQVNQILFTELEYFGQNKIFESTSHRRI